MNIFIGFVSCIYRLVEITSVKVDIVLIILWSCVLLLLNYGWQVFDRMKPIILTILVGWLINVAVIGKIHIIQSM
jgi:hypothetical protein